MNKIEQIKIAGDISDLEALLSRKPELIAHLDVVDALTELGGEKGKYGIRLPQLGLPDNDSFGLIVTRLGHTLLSTNNQRIFNNSERELISYSISVSISG